MRERERETRVILYNQLCHLSTRRAREQVNCGLRAPSGGACLKFALLAKNALRMRSLKSNHQHTKCVYSVCAVLCFVLLLLLLLLLYWQHCEFLYFDTSNLTLCVYVNSASSLILSSSSSSSRRELLQTTCNLSSASKLLLCESLTAAAAA